MIKPTAKDAVRIILVVVVLYGIVSMFVFSIRHPWATDKERLLHIWDAYRFRYVPYDEMRPREKQ